MIAINSIDEYFILMKTHPEFFVESDIYPIETDRKTLLQFAEDRNVPLGVVYKSQYTILVVDLIKKSDGGHFTYERILPVSTGTGVVCVPVFDKKLILMRQYRHAMREYQLCFPRGYGEDGVPATENAKKELKEEIGAVTGKLREIGTIIADSGRSGTKTLAVLCEILSYAPQNGHEGIENIEFLSIEQFEEKVTAGKINDGFTLAAYTLCRDILH